LDIGSGSSASGSGGSIAISVGSGTDIGGAFSVTRLATRWEQLEEMRLSFLDRHRPAAAGA
jgi:hypothetical protein